MNDEHILMGPALWGEPASISLASSLPKGALSRDAMIALSVAGRLYAQRVPYGPREVAQLAATDGTPIEENWLHQASLCTDHQAPVGAASRIGDRFARHGAMRAIEVARASLDSPSTSAQAVIRALVDSLGSMLAHGTTGRTATLSVGLTALIEAVNSRSSMCPTPWSSLNKIIGGFISKKLYILGARPSMGKTSVILEVSRWLASAGKSGLFFTVETDLEDIVGRYVAAETGASILADIVPGMSQGLIEAATQKLLAFEDKILLNDSVRVTVEAVRNEVMAIRAGGRSVDYLMIDYLQIMEINGRNRNEGFGDITRQLRELAKELDVFIILASQLSRKSEYREGSLYRPVLSDLRDTGSAEQDAYVVILLWRPAYHGITEEVHPSGAITHFRDGHTELIVAKNKNGPIGTAVLYWDQAKSTFSDGGYSISPS